MHVCRSSANKPTERTIYCAIVALLHLHILFLIITSTYHRSWYRHFGVSLVGLGAVFSIPFQARSFLLLSSLFFFSFSLLWFSSSSSLFAIFLQVDHLDRFDGGSSVKIVAILTFDFTEMRTVTYRTRNAAPAKIFFSLSNINCHLAERFYWNHKSVCKCLQICINIQWNVWPFNFGTKISSRFFLWENRVPFFRLLALIEKYAINRHFYIDHNRNVNFDLFFCCFFYLLHLFLAITWASWSGTPAFFRKPCSSALIPLPK